MHRRSYKLPKALLLIVLGLIVVLVALPQDSISVRLEPIAYWGVYIDGVPFDMRKLDAFETAEKKQVSLVHWGQPWVINGAFQGFQTEEFAKVRAHGAIPIINWGSWSLGDGVNQTDFTLRAIYEGKYDDYVGEWASEAKAWGHPFFLRFDHEMNGWWYPWAERANGNQAGDFIKAWRHVHTIFKEVGATNVTWVWSVNVEGEGTAPLSSVYPGDEYVDWMSMDGYNSPGLYGAWSSFYQVFHETYDDLVVLAPTKPLMISEVATTEEGGANGSPGSKAEWIKDAFASALPDAFLRVKGVIWFNWNDRDPSLDWPVDSSQSSIDAFAQAIAPCYYAANDYAGSNVSPIPPPNEASNPRHNKTHIAIRLSATWVISFCIPFEWR